MAGEQSTAVSTKTCTQCGESKAAELFRPGKRQCRECYRARRREKYATDAATREKALKYASDQRERLRADPNGRSIRRHWKRNTVARYRAAGLTREGKPKKLPRWGWVRGIAPDAHWDRLAEANALQAWRYWIRVKAPIGWRAAYHEASGREPWLAPGLRKPERHILRYSHDDVFAQRERARLGAKKRERRAVIAAQRAARVPGVLWPEDERLIRDSADRCHYCLRPFARDRIATLDHVVALSMGGLHVASNVVVACRSCNSSKQDGAAPVWRETK
jgi:5-methylcytosine-specific restriction endonuclease McrA